LSDDDDDTKSKKTAPRGIKRNRVDRKKEIQKSVSKGREKRRQERLQERSSKKIKSLEELGNEAKSYESLKPAQKSMLVKKIKKQLPKDQAFRFQSDYRKLEKKDKKKFLLRAVSSLLKEAQK
tara:strand:+ start:40 stop:408 length:369 start_codon:yes stop_codon:yes gene_type:complete